MRISTPIASRDWRDRKANVDSGHEISRRKNRKHRMQDAQAQQKIRRARKILMKTLRERGRWKQRVAQGGDCAGHVTSAAIGSAASTKGDAASPGRVPRAKTKPSTPARPTTTAY